MGTPSEDLAVRLKDAAIKKVGGKALTSKFGIDCFALADTLLRSLNAQTAEDFGTVTANADYAWGDEVELGAIKPGDILQFRDHVVETHTKELRETGWKETESRTQRRPHHTAVVIEVPKDGGVVVVEQNVRPDPKKVMRNVIPVLAPGEDTHYESNRVKTEIKVTGTVRAYRPVLKSKGASLLRPGGWRMLANVIPAQGGTKHPPGPVGVG
jgi:hypothetical protein